MGKNINSILQIYLLRFMEKYPTGVISKKQFSDEMGVEHYNAKKNVDNVDKMMTMIAVTQGGILCDSVYGMFDEDNSGSMDFQENMTVIIIIIPSQC